MHLVLTLVSILVHRSQKYTCSRPCKPPRRSGSFAKVSSAPTCLNRQHMRVCILIDGELEAAYCCLFLTYPFKP
jgi:hypothetical protein